jgi:hypothetical protein
MRGVDHLRICGSSVPSKLPEQIFPDAAPRPANEPVIDRGRRTILGWTIAPAAATFQHVYDAADDPTIIYSLHSADIRRQMRLDPLPLLVVQPEKVAAHDPDPSKRIRIAFSTLKN